MKTKPANSNSKSKTRIRFFIFAIAALLNGCALAIPVHEATPPEVLDKGSFRIGQMTGSAPMVATTRVDQSKDGLSGALAGYRLEVGVAEKWQLELQTFGGGIAGVGYTAGAKYQWSGSPYFKAKKGNSVQSTSFKYWNGAAPASKVGITNTATLYSGDLSGDGFTVAHVWGKRLADWFGVYAGPKIATGNIKADYRTTENGPIVSTDRRSFVGYGPIAGFYFAPHSEQAGFDVVLEGQALNMPATFGDDRTMYYSWMLNLALPLNIF